MGQSGRRADRRGPELGVVRGPRPGREGAAPGHIILLNGTPSSGKTTVARALWDELEPPHWYRSLDDFRQGYQERHWLADPRPLFERVFRGFVRSIAEMAWAGHSVITEAVILPGNADTYLDALEGLTVVLVGVRCPLSVAQQRERQRTDRLGGPIDLAVPDFDAVHRDVPYDIDFDTSIVKTAGAVRRVRARLSSGEALTAFDLLRARRGSA